MSPEESRPPAVWRRVDVSLDCLHDATGGRAPGAESGGSRAILPEQEEQVRVGGVQGVARRRAGSQRCRPACAPHAMPGRSVLSRNRPVSAGSLLPPDSALSTEPAGTPKSHLVAFEQDPAERRYADERQAFGESHDDYRFDRVPERFKIAPQSAHHLLRPLVACCQVLRMGAPVCSPRHDLNSSRKARPTPPMSPSASARSPFLKGSGSSRAMGSGA